jgi:hypothetical protein
MIGRWFLSLSTLLIACQPAFIDGAPNEKSPYFEIPVDSTFVLQQPLTVPPRTDSVYFQSGQILAWYDVNEYSSYCVLRLNSKSETIRRVEPDRFVVRRVSTEFFFQLARRYAPVARAVRVASMGRDRDGESYQVAAMVMALVSARQPEVARLTCADWTLPQGSPAITVQKIRQALGPFFDLQLATRTPYRKQ